MMKTILISGVLTFVEVILMICALEPQPVAKPEHGFKPFYFGEKLPLSIERNDPTSILSMTHNGIIIRYTFMDGPEKGHEYLDHVAIPHAVWFEQIQSHYAMPDINAHGIKYVLDHIGEDEDRRPAGVRAYYKLRGN